MTRPRHYVTQAMIDRHQPPGGTWRDVLAKLNAGQIPFENGATAWAREKGRAA